jgi:hypothetical protein
MNNCNCGFTAKNETGLKAHKRFCKNMNNENKKDSGISLGETSKNTIVYDGTENSVPTLSEEALKAAQNMSVIPKELPKYITEEQLDNKLNGFLTQIAGIIDQKPKVEAKKENVDFLGRDYSENKGLPAEYRELVNKYLGEEFDAELSYPSKDKKGNKTGFVFTIVVPVEKSNAPEDYLAYYKKDVRSTPINPNEGLDGVERYIRKVAQNLGIDIRFIR